MMLWDRPAKPNLHVCCNDPDNGLFNGRAAALSIGSAELELRGWHEPKFVDLGGAIRLAGKNWPVSASKEWVGNWCWNAYRIGDASKTAGWWMVDFATWLRGRGLFQCTAGPVDFHEWFNGEYELAPATIHTALFETVATPPPADTPTDTEGADQ